MPGRKGGRPPEKESAPSCDIPAMAQAVRAYTQECADAENGFPILKECCLQNDWDYEDVMALQRRHSELARAVKGLLAQKEICLERLSVAGAIDKTVAMFSLKQLGWRDRAEAVESAPRGDVADELDKHFAKRKSDANR